MHSSHNDGLGLSTNNLVADLTQLYAKDEQFQLDIVNLEVRLDNLNPTNVDGQISTLQSKDIVIDQALSNLRIGYSNNSNAIAAIEIGSSGNYDAEILALQNSNISINNLIEELEINDTYLNSNLLSLATGYSNNSNSINSLNIKENLDIAFLNTGISNNINSINGLSLATSNFSLSSKQISDTLSLNNGISNLSLGSSNYVLQTSITSINDILTTHASDIQTNEDSISALSAKEILDVSFLNTGFSNTKILVDGHSIDIQNLNLATTNTSLDVSALSVLTSNFALTSTLTTTTNSLNDGISNLSVLSSNFTTNNTNIAGDLINLNEGISNLSLSSSNYATITSVTTVDTAIDDLTIVVTDLSTKQTSDALSLNNGISNLSVLSSNFTTNNTNISGDVLNLNSGISNLSVLSSNYSTVTQQLADFSNVNVGISNNTSSISTVSIDLAFQVAKEAIDVGFLNTGISNANTSININTAAISTNATNIANQVSKEDIDVGFLNTGYSNNLGLINTNISAISTNATNIANQVSKEAIDVNFLNIGYSNNLGLINTNTSAISTLSTKQINDVSSLNAFSSNISTLSSNYATLSGTETLTNKTISSSTIDYNNNTILNFPTGGGGGSGDVTLTGVQTLTNKTIDFNDNFLLNLPTSGTPSVSNITFSNVSDNSTIDVTNISNPYKCKIKLAADVLDIPANTNTKLVLTVVEWDPSSMFNATSNRIDIPITGYYDLRGQVTWMNTVSNVTTNFFIFINGVYSEIENEAFTPTAGNYTTAGVSVLKKLNAGDYVELYCSTVNNSTVDVNDNGTYLEVILHSPETVVPFSFSTSNYVQVNSFTYEGTGNIMTGQENSNNYIPVWSSNNSTYLNNGIDANSLVTLTGAQTLTEKTISSSTIDYNNNTILNFPTGGGGGGSEFTTTALKTANYTAVTGDEVIVDANGAAATFAITLPATPVAGNQVRIVMVTEHATRFVTIGRNGSPIDGRNSTEGEVFHTLWRNGDSVTFKYLGGSAGWVAVERNITPRFVTKVFLGTIQLNIPNTANTKCQVDTIVYDYNNSWDVTNKRWICPFAGVWRFSLCINFTTVVAARIHNILCYKNGTTTAFYSSLHSAIASDVIVNTTGTLVCAAGDFFEMWFWQSSGATTDINSGQQATWMDISYVSR